MAKILFYTHGLVDGGAERLWACLATALKARGHDVSFAVDYAASDNAGNLDPGIPLTVLGRNHTGSLVRLARLLRRDKPDIAFSAAGGSNIKLVLAGTAAASPTKLVVTYHGSVEASSGRLAYLGHKLLPAISRRAARVVAVSNGLAEELVSKWHADPARTLAIMNPVFFPSEATAPAAAELAARDDVILAAGRLSPEKDFVTLLRAFAKLDRPGARLVILGKGPERERLEAEIARLGIGGAVEMPGYCPAPWTYYQKAKVLVSSSTSELFGNTLVEGLAYGLPVVATRCVGPREIITSPEHGRLVGIGDSDALAAAIRSTLDDPGDPAPRRQRAEQFSFDERVPVYEAFIDDILADAKLPFGRLAQSAGLIAAAATIERGSHAIDLAGHF